MILTTNHVAIKYNKINYPIILAYKMQVMDTYFIIIKYQKKEMKLIKRLNKDKQSIKLKFNRTKED